MRALFDCIKRMRTRRASEAGAQRRMCLKGMNSNRKLWMKEKREVGMWTARTVPGWAAMLRSSD